MEISDFQLRSSLTLDNNKSDQMNISFFAEKLKEETAEVLFEIFPSNPDKDFDKVKLTNELGDLIRVCSQLATLHEINLSAVLIGNLDKMEARFKNNKSGRCD